MSVAQKFYPYQLQSLHGPGSGFYHFSIIILKQLEDCHHLKLLPNISHTGLHIAAAASILELLFSPWKFRTVARIKEPSHTHVSLAMEDNSSHYTPWYKPSQSRRDTPHLLTAVLSDTQGTEGLLCQNFLRSSLSNTTFSSGCTFLAQPIQQNAEML